MQRSNINTSINAYTNTKANANTDMHSKTSPASMKIIAFKFFAATAIVLFLPALPVIHLSIESEYQQDNKHATSWTSWIPFPPSIRGLWIFSAFTALADEWNLIHLLFDLLEQSRSGQTSNPYGLTEKKEKMLSSFDSGFMITALYGIIFSCESVYRTAIHDKSKPRDEASIITRGTVVICCLAIYSHTGALRYDGSGTIVRPTKLRRSIWLLVLAVSSLAATYGIFMGSRFWNGNGPSD